MVETYDVDFDHQLLETEKYDAKTTYKKFLGYRPGVYVIGDKIDYIENSDGTTNVRIHQADTHKRFFALLESQNIRVNRFRADCDGDWGEILFDFENGTGSIVRLADWDTMISNVFAKRVILYLLNCENDRLPKETMFAFEMYE